MSPCLQPVPSPRSRSRSVEWRSTSDPAAPALPVAALILLVLLLLGLGGCADNAPFRVTEASASVDCRADEAGRLLEPACRTMTVEVSHDQYNLMFVEFDDQGLQFPDKPFGEAAAFQITDAMKRLNALAADHGKLTIFVYVHGWRHNAAHDDDDVRNFRKLLHDSALIEQSRGTGHRVVGIYVGWRGLSARFAPFRELSFWTRKNAALHVAQGSARELFARLRGFRCAQSRRNGAADCNDQDAFDRSNVRLFMIGHSFGALVLYNAVAGSLVEAMTRAHDGGVRGAPTPRFADMVVLLNPAFEATRYTPLHRIATLGPPATAEPPLMIAITGSADDATRVFFPIGRTLNSLFQRTVNDEEERANTNTIGHMPLYLTHTLVGPGPGSRPYCPQWVAAVGDGDRLPDEQLKANVEAEQANADEYQRTFGRASRRERGWSRTFCSGAVLMHNGAHDPHSVLWNVIADNNVIRDHSDVDGPVLWGVLRQLYLDLGTYKGERAQPYIRGRWRDQSR